MSKMRVYEIAKEVGLESKVLVAKLVEMGYPVRNHASSLEAEEANRLIEQFKAERQANIVEKRLASGVIRRRTRPSRQRAAETKTAEQNPAGEQAQVVATGETAPSPAPGDAPEQTPPATAEEAPAPGEKSTKERQVEATADAERAKEQAQEKTGAEKPQPKPKKKQGGDFYRAQVIRRIEPDSNLTKHVEPRHNSTEVKSGVRVLKVVPGREGRGHEFIDMSKRDRARAKTSTSKKKKRVELREQLFDAYSVAYVPGRSRRRRMARRGGKKTQLTTPKAQKRVIKMESETILASELARSMGVKLVELNHRLLELGADIAGVREDSYLDMETAVLAAQEFDYQIQDATFKEDQLLQSQSSQPDNLSPRPPVVTVMGHVDHGKTSILDAIRKTKVTEAEEGGITQHIGAYEVHLPQGSITFIDTPGHEAFTAMRARGASITDIVVLVVAADDGIMPQTIEAIHHSQDAGVPIVVAINKIDLPGVNTEKIRQKLTEFNLVPEAWGGDTIIVEVSAKTKQGLDELLEAILLQAEMLELQADADKPATGSVVEARLDRGRGPVATFLVREGTLRKGEYTVVGTAHGRIRAAYDFEGRTMDETTPGRPVQVQGLNEVPPAGEIFHVVKNEREAKRVIQHRKEEARQARQGETARLNLEDFYEKLQGVEKPELKVVIKADVQGTAEAVKQAVEKLSVPKVGVKVIHHGVGAVNETDINLASASRAVVVGFNVRPDPNAKKLAQATSVDIRFYKVIYDLTEDIRRLQVGLLPANKKETTVGRAEVRELFNIPKIGTVAGVSVLDGKILRGSLVRLLRDSVEVYQGRIGSLRRFKEDVREVTSGHECGIGIENFNDIRRGDIIESFQVEEERPTL